MKLSAKAIQHALSGPYKRCRCACCKVRKQKLTLKQIRNLPSG